MKPIRIISASWLFKMIFSYYWINFIMARTTINNSITNFISQILKKMPRSYVMNNTISSAEFYSTILANLIISLYNFSSPYPIIIFIFCCSMSRHAIFVIPSPFTEYWITRTETRYFKNRDHSLGRTFNTTEFSLMFSRKLKISHLKFFITLKTICSKFTKMTTIRSNTFYNLFAHSYSIS